MDFGIIAWLVALFISYRAGKFVGGFKSHKMIINFLRGLKHQIDDGLRQTIGSEYRLHIHVADEVVVCENSTEAGKLSVSLGEILSMVKPMQEAHPPRP